MLQVEPYTPILVTIREFTGYHQTYLAVMRKLVVIGYSALVAIDSSDFVAISSSAFVAIVSSTRGLVISDS